MALINPTIPTIGQPNSTEDQDVANALTTIVAAVNGGLDAANLAAAAVTSVKLATDAKVLLTTDTATSTQTVTTTLADVTGLTLTVTPTVASYYLAVLAVPMINTGGDDNGIVVLDVDGATVSTDRTSIPNGTAYQGTGFSVHAGTLTAAAHPFKGRVQAFVGGQITLTGTQRLYVVSWPQ